MPRHAREKSSTNIYHIILRGINRQNIFLDNRDRRTFLKFLKEVKQDSPFILHAYCLMDNHIHLLLHETDAPLETVMKRVGIKYAIYFNSRYLRTGHVFQDRFKSENVEDDRYFLTVLRYILQNPVKAGMCPCPGDYRWSSYEELFQPGSWIDTDMAVSMLGKKELISFICMKNEDLCMDFDNDKEYKAGKIQQAIIKKLGGVVFSDLTRPEQDEWILTLLEDNFSGPQIRDTLHIGDHRIRAVQKRHANRLD